MNALTQIKNTQKATMREIESGMGEEASWHARYKHSAYVYAGGLAFNMTEGDILTVFSQFGRSSTSTWCATRRRVGVEDSRSFVTPISARRC